MEQYVSVVWRGQAGCQTARLRTKRAKAETSFDVNDVNDDNLLVSMIYFSVLKQNKIA